MSVLIINCNHWIGFHMVNKLLEHDYTVEGIIDSNTTNDLSMFFGRNSSFSLVADGNGQEYETCIVVGDDKKADTIKAKRKFIINPERENTRGTFIQVHTPLLFGEWMPMNEQGLFKGDKFVAFDSKEFKNKAIYINVFTSALLQWMKSGNIPNNIEVNPEQDRLEEILENSVYLRDNGPMEKRLKDVKKHYELYKNFYNGN